MATMLVTEAADVRRLSNEASQRESSRMEVAA